MLSFALMSRVFPSALIAVAYNRGIVALASIASLAVIFPAFSAAVNTVLNNASCALMVWPLMLCALMVSSTICMPPSVSPAAISSSVTSTGCVCITPSEPTITA